MMLLIAFISVVNGFYFACKIEYLCIVIQLLSLIYSYYRFKYKGLLINVLSIICYCIGLLLINIKFSNVNSTFIVVKAESNYILVSNIFKTYYVKVKNSTYEIGDILYIKGSLIDLKFSTFEQCFDFENYLKSYNCFQQVNNYKLELKHSTFLRLNSFKNYLLNSYSTSSKDLISSLIFKDSMSNLSSYKEFTKSGITYLLSTSGIHIMVLNNFIKDNLKRKLDDYKVNIICSCIIFIFYILSSFSISIFRILLMNILCCLNFKKNWNLDYISRLSICGLIILLFYPFYELNVGFYYSFVVLFVFYFVKNIIPKRGLFLKLKSTFLFFLTCLPLNLMNNYGFNILSSTLSFIFSKLFCCLFVIDLFVFIPVVTVPFLDKLNSFIYNLIIKIPSFNLFIVSGEFNKWLVFIAYSLFLIIVLLKELNFKRYYKLSIISISLLMIISFLPYNFDKYEVIFINVGQGDSTLIRYKQQNILIDTGGSNYNDLALDCLIPYFNKLKIRKLDGVLITHSDNDHAGSLTSLKKNFKIDKVIENGLDNPIYFSDLKIEDLNKYKSSTSEDNNYNSCVFKFKIKETKFLITGDAPIQIENYMIKDNLDIKADVIKIGHHGSDTSSSYNFLERVNPKLAIISCGYNNIYKHPSSKVLDRLDRLNIKYIRTDMAGSIVYKC